MTLSFCMILLMNQANAQDINMAKHRWQKRIICIISVDSDSTQHKDQIDELTESVKGLEARKLMIYDIQKDRYQILFPKEMKSQWIYSNNLYQKYSETDVSFKILLIGLDGNIKLRRAEIVSKKDLFRIIDSMPMRRAEMRDDRH